MTFLAEHAPIKEKRIRKIPQPLWFGDAVKQK